MDRSTPLWQLESGWNLDGRGPYRWAARPLSRGWRGQPAQNSLRPTVNVAKDFFKYVRGSRLRVLIDGRLIGEHNFDRAAVEVLHWNLDPAPPGTARVEFEVPGFRLDPQGELFGLSVGNFGFLP